MRADLDDLLTDAGREPTRPADPDAIWAGGRRRRTLRRASGALAGAAGVLVLGVAVTSFAVGGTAVPEVEPLAPEGHVADDTADTADTADSDDTTADDTVEPEPAPEPAPTDPGGEQDAKAEDPPADAPAPDAPAEPAEPAPATPEPDPAALADPCAPHEAGTSFIDVVAPVDGQVVEDELDLVGCASVFEATVRYRVTDAGGGVVTDGFTTATAGGPEIGEFRDTIDLAGVRGDLTVEVFWEDVSDGSERDVVTRQVTVG